MLIRLSKTKKQLVLQQQNGFALIASMVILLILTVIGVSASDMNSVQMIMARNHQYYNESFYAAYSEIDAQITEIANYDVVNNGVPPALNGLNEDGTPRDQAVILSLPAGTLTQEKNQFANVSGCPAWGESSNSSSGGAVKCQTFQVHTTIRATNTSIGSDQRQEFTYWFPGSSQ